MAGLRDKLLDDGSPLSYGNGQTPATNPLATRQSKLHTDGGAPGYSIAGYDFGTVNAAFQTYNDGYPNILPPPSQLDINGVAPTVPLSDPSYGSINDSFSQGQYLNNLPG